MANYRDNSNIGWKILSLFLALVLVAGIITGVVFWQKGNIVFNPVKQEQTEEKPEDNGGAVVGESTGNGVKLMTAKIAKEDYAANGISPLAETAYTLTATITPSNATIQDVDWSVSFVNNSSAWATGKTVTDYVTVTPTEDGALTANVECLQAFGEQIKVTVTSREISSVKADCTVDYRQKFQSLTGYISLDTASGKKVEFSDTLDTRRTIAFPLADNSQKEYLSTHTGEISITPIGSDVYTLPMEYEITKVEMKLATNQARGWVEYPANFTTSHGELSELAGVTYEGGTCTGKMQEFMGVADYSNGNVSSARANLYSYLGGGNDSDRYSEFVVHYNFNGEEKTFSFGLIYDRSTLGVAVSGVDLSDSNIIF